ncbi:response regulator transcription factor [Pampinifervens florentissimum]|uniref:response regulator transcription factor n=1 Tax=Pampinifervens florentissimum TaxID=1632019 RepID=UPI0013B47DE0|nr:response regulator transcription factor [Hydrogenobacter sp. T-8]QID32399.1 response regulator transcription factor [Hydrogenobacter sp. T-8]
MRVLLVEDDTSLATALKELLEQEGYRVRLVLDGKRGLDLALSEEFDLILLDYFLPTMDGREFLKRLRSEGSKVPVIALTVVSDIKNKVDFFQTGADDYITKPFHFEELLARIGAVLRRYAGLESAEVDLGDVRINLSQKKVFVGQEEVSLTLGEYLILEYLVRNRGRFVSREELLEKALKSYEAESNTVEVLIHRLRKKIGRDIIKTQRGLGYRIL